MKQKNYEKHYHNQRERILEAAETLFIRDGLDNVTISSIAKTARVARITLYEYYANKEEIAWAIFQRHVESSKALFSELTTLPGKNGYSKLEELINIYITNLEESPQNARFIVEFDTLYSRESTSENMKKIVEQSWPDASMLYKRFIQEGVLDGSLRSDLDVDKVSIALSNLINALNGRFALLGKQIQLEYEQPAKEIYQEICQIFLQGIKSS